MPAQGLSPSLLSELMDQIRCDELTISGFDSYWQAWWLTQVTPSGGAPLDEDFNRVHWEHYWDCQPCCYPDRSSDLCSVVTVNDAGCGQRATSVLRHHAEHAGTHRHPDDRTRQGRHPWGGNTGLRRC